MTQTYQMKHNAQGTIYSLLTVESDGQMTMTFHGTDRELSQEATLTEDGRIATGGSLFPGLESGKWNKMDDGRGLKADVVETADCADSTDNEPVQGTVPAVGSEAESERTTEGLSPMCAEPAVPVEPEPTYRGQAPCNPVDSTYRGQSPCNPPSATHTGDSPRRQRKQRKPRVERQHLDISHQTSDVIHQPSNIDRHQPSATLKAVGMVAAATVALFVIYETGLLIPLGLIGLATGGILK